MPEGDKKKDAAADDAERKYVSTSLASHFSPPSEPSADYIAENSAIGSHSARSVVARQNVSGSCRVV